MLWGQFKKYGVLNWITRNKYLKLIILMIDKTQYLLKKDPTIVIDLQNLKKHA